VLAFVGDLTSADRSQAEAAELHSRLWRLRRNLAHDCEVDELIGESPAIQRVRSQVELASTGRLRVVIYGPNGSGREHVARLLHRRAMPEPFMPLVPLCCPLANAELLQNTITDLVRHADSMVEESEQGAVTGAPTLLLLEVDQLSEEAQAELAGFLELPSFELYAIATSEVSLIELAREGHFRKDLAFALSTLSIELPPLSQRREDIPLLSQHFLERFNASGDRQLAGFSPEAVDELVGFPWPDNVDELADLVEKACAAAEGPLVETHDLPRSIQYARSADAHPRRKDEPIKLDEFLARIERELIVRALKRCKGNKTKAAKLLGVTRARLHRRVEHFGLS
jgi:DNA-binding NtrC family response regulator